MMSKTQIIAKVMLTFMGILIVESVLAYGRVLVPSYAALDSTAYSALLCVLLFVLSVVIAKLMILSNDGMAQRIVGADEPLGEEAERLWLAGALRIALLVAGMLLLFDSLEMVLRVINLPLHMWDFINSIIWSESLGRAFASNVERIVLNTFRVVKLAAGLYLVFGAPHFVRWQLAAAGRRRTVGQFTKGASNG